MFSHKATRKKALRRIGLGLSALILLLLLWQIYRRVDQTAGGWHAVRLGNPAWLLASVSLLVAGLSVEAQKWKLLLAFSGIRVSFQKALVSVLSGIAVSVVTPNRVGDYPARMLALQVKPYRSAVAALLGALSQMAALLCWGVPAAWLSGSVRSLLPFPLTGLLAVGGAGAGLSLYFGASRWTNILLRIRPLRRFAKTGRMLRAVPRRTLVNALLWSMLRFALYTTQLWIMFHWLSLPLSFPEGWLQCALYFWLLAIIPNIALAEVGIRGTVALYLFASVSPNAAAIFTTTLSLWLLNLALPALVGAWFWTRWKQPFATQSV